MKKIITILFFLISNQLLFSQYCTIDTNSIKNIIIDKKIKIVQANNSISQFVSMFNETQNNKVLTTKNCFCFYDIYIDSLFYTLVIINNVTDKQIKNIKHKKGRLNSSESPLIYELKIDKKCLKFVYTDWNNMNYLSQFLN